jgi:xylose isomerase
MIQDGMLARLVHERYAGWRTAFGRDILDGKSSLEALAAHVLGADTDPEPVSGRQEYLENLVNRFC